MSFTDFAQLGSHMAEFVAPSLGKGQALWLLLKEKLLWGHCPQLHSQASSVKDLLKHEHNIAAWHIISCTFQKYWIEKKDLECLNIQAVFMVKNTGAKTSLQEDYIKGLFKKSNDTVQ